MWPLQRGVGALLPSANAARGQAWRVYAPVYAEGDGRGGAPRATRGARVRRPCWAATRDAMSGCSWIRVPARRGTSRRVPLRRREARAFSRHGTARGGGAAGQSHGVRGLALHLPGCWRRRAERRHRRPRPLRRGGEPRSAPRARSCGRRRALRWGWATQLPGMGVPPQGPRRAWRGARDGAAPSFCHPAQGSRAFCTEEASAARSISTPRAREAPKSSPLRHRATRLVQCRAGMGGVMTRTRAARATGRCHARM